jgi:hypothetical protein
MFDSHSLKPLRAECGEPQLRVVAVLIVAALCGALIWVLASLKGYTRLGGALFFAVPIVWGMRRLLQERAIVSHLGASVGTVRSSEQFVNEDGYNYSVEYKFDAADGEAHIGNSAVSRKEAPAKDSPIIVGYSTVNPDENLPLEVFWFYKFNGVRHY